MGSAVMCRTFSALLSPLREQLKLPVRTSSSATIDFACM
jgi:hypothetical protein